MLYDWLLNRWGVPRPVWASSTGVNKPTFWIAEAQALEIGRSQIVKQDALLERKQTLLFGTQGSFNRATLAMEPVHIAIESILVE
jgi:hypothetical protein